MQRASNFVLTCTMEGPPGAEVPASNPEAAAATPASYDQGSYDQTGQYTAEQYAAWAAYYAQNPEAYAAYTSYYSGQQQATGTEHAGSYDQSQYDYSSTENLRHVAYPSGYQQPQQQADILTCQPSHTVWVGNLPIGTSDTDLRNLFAQYGTIENVKLLHEKNCAFIRFAEIIQALEAHNKMQGRFISGQQLKMGWGKPDDRDDGPPPCRNLWLGNVGMFAFVSFS